MSGGGRVHCTLNTGDLAGHARARSVEAQHRTLVQLGMGALLALSVVPATGRPRDLVSPIVGHCREILERCALALQAAGAAVHWIPLALLGVGLLHAILDRTRLHRRVRRFLGAHSWRTPYRTEPIGRLASELRCSGNLRVIVGPAPNPAFTAGLFRPRVYVSADLQHRFGPAELRAVVQHELYHLRRYDPLRFALLRFAQRTLFWLPLIGLLAEDLMEDAELMADDFAAEASSGGDPIEVASALVKLGRVNAETLAGGIASIGGFRLLDRRVRRLASERVAPPPPFRWPPALFSAAALAVMWLASALAPARVDEAMTMGWRDRCPHAMHGSQSRCPECEHQPPEAMPDCDR